MNNNISCPVDNVSVNENKVRTTAFFVLLIGIVYLATSCWLFAAFLTLDFALRAFNLNTYSALGIISGVVVKQLKLKNKPTDRAPKRFAALIGFVFSAFILATSLLHLTIISQAATAVLLVFASLESFAGFCAGCYLYSFMRRLSLVK
jgi:hypothetical protein